MKRRIDPNGLTQRLVTIEQFCGSRPIFSKSGLRWMIFSHSEEMADAGALIRIGRRVLLDPIAFDCWIAKQQR